MVLANMPSGIYANPLMKFEVARHRGFEPPHTT